MCQDDGPVPAILEEGGCGAEHSLSLDLAGGPIYLQPVLRVIILGVAVGEEGRRVQNGTEPEQNSQRCVVMCRWEHTHLHTHTHTHTRPL